MRPSCTCCRRSGSATPGHGKAAARGRYCPGPAEPVNALSRPITPMPSSSSSSTIITCTAMATCRCSSPRTRPTTRRLFDSPNAGPYVKDGFDSYLVHGRGEAINPGQTGSKAAPHYHLSVDAGSSRTVRLRLSRTAPVKDGNSFTEFDEIFAARIAEADAFYDDLTPASIKADTDRVNVMRQALAGMLWTKQYFYYDVDEMAGRAPHGTGTAQQRSATASGSTCSTTTSSPCRTSGSTPGTPPGTWPSTCCRSPSSITTLPRSSWT